MPRNNVRAGAPIVSNDVRRGRKGVRGGAWRGAQEAPKEQARPEQVLHGQARQERVLQERVPQERVPQERAPQAEHQRDTETFAQVWLARGALESLSMGRWNLIQLERWANWLPTPIGPREVQMCAVGSAAPGRYDR